MKKLLSLFLLSLLTLTTLNLSHAQNVLTEAEKIEIQKVIDMQSVRFDLSQELPISNFINNFKEVDCPVAYMDFTRIKDYISDVNIDLLNFNLSMRVKCNKATNKLELNISRPAKYVTNDGAVSGIPNPENISNINALETLKVDATRELRIVLSSISASDCKNSYSDLTKREGVYINKYSLSEICNPEGPYYINGKSVSLQSFAENILADMEMYNQKRNKKVIRDSDFPSDISFGFSMDLSSGSTTAKANLDGIDYKYSGTDNVAVLSECLNLTYGFKFGINNATYKSNDKNAKGQVTKIQNFLKSKGYLIGVNANGNYGPKTVKAVKDFQRDNNLVVTGVVGKVTRDKINYLSCN